MKFLQECPKPVKRSIFNFKYKNHIIDFVQYLPEGGFGLSKFDYSSMISQSFTFTYAACFSRIKSATFFDTCREMHIVIDTCRNIKMKELMRFFIKYFNCKI